MGTFLGMSSMANAQNPESELGWKLGSQAYTFNHFTFFEAVEKIKEANLEYVEAFPGQTIGGGIEREMDFKKEYEKKKQILKKLDDEGVQLLSFGVVGVGNTEEWKQLF